MAKTRTVIEWINDYTAVVPRQSDDEEGDELYVTPRSRPTDRLSRLKFTFDKLLTPRNEYTDIHRERDEMKARITTMNDEKAIVEVVYGHIKHYGYRSVGEMVRRK